MEDSERINLEQGTLAKNEEKSINEKSNIIINAKEPKENENGKNTIMNNLVNNKKI